MDSIRIDSGIKRISINDDPERVIEFNPTDVSFVERFYELIRTLEEKQAEYLVRAEAIDMQGEFDEYGLPANVGEKLAFVREVCEFMYQQIDTLFGPGTSQKVFDGVLNLDGIGQFFEGITPFIQSARTERVAKYVSTGKKKRVMK